MDIQIPPVFYKTSSPFGAEALLTSKAIDKSISRARVPETISCLWATGSFPFFLLLSFLFFASSFPISFPAYKVHCVHTSGACVLASIVRS